MQVLRIPRNRNKNNILFQVGDGQLHAIFETVIKPDLSVTEADDLFSLDFQELIQLRDILNEYAPPEQYQMKKR